jgi:hypothetical protein
MYSPKIDEELIPRIYRLGKLKKMPMTLLVNEILQRGLSEMEEKERANGNHLLNLGGRE